MNRFFLVFILCFSGVAIITGQSSIQERVDVAKKMESINKDSMFIALYAILDEVVQVDSFEEIGSAAYALAYRLQKYSKPSEEIIEVCDFGIEAYKKIGFKGYEMARLYYYKGVEYEKLNDFEMAVKSFDAIGDYEMKSRKAINSFLNGRASIAKYYRLNGDADLAILILEQVIEDSIFTQGNLENQHFLLKELAIAYGISNEFSGLEKGIAICDRILSEKEDPAILMQKARFYRNLEQYKLSREFYTEASNIYLSKQTAWDSTQYVKCLNNISDSYILDGKQDEAIEFLESKRQNMLKLSVENALRLEENYLTAKLKVGKSGTLLDDYKNVSAKDLEEVDQGFLIIHYNTQAISNLDAYRKKASDKTIAKAAEMVASADSVITLLESKLKTVDSRLKQRETFLNTYQLGVDIGFLTNNMDMVYYYGEKANNYLLYNDVKNGNPESLKEEMRIIKLINQKKGDQSKLKKDLLGLQSQRIKSYIHSQDLRGAEIADLSEVSNYYKDHTVLLFCEGVENLYALHVQGENIQTNKIGNKDVIYGKLDSIKIKIGNKKELNTLKLLSKRFFIKEDEGYTLIPTPQMSGFPFEVMIDSKLQRGIRYLPSLNLGMLLTGENAIMQASIISPNYTDMEESKERKDRTFQLLQHSLNEAMNISEALDVSSEQSVSTSSFLENLRDYNLIHYTGHAVDEADANYSYLPLSNDPADRIYSYEIASERSNASLVVLNACDTNNGELLKGEGVLSLTRSLFKAGVKSIVSTLWLVPDETSAQILSLFYEYLLQGMTKSEALAQAKTDFLGQCPDYQKHPYYWAGIVVTGNDEPLIFKSQIESTNRNVLFFLLTIGVGLLALAYYFKRKNNSTVPQ